MKNVLDKQVLIFLGLMVLSVFFNYFTPDFVAGVFYVTLLYLYYRSKNEGFWLAFFLVISDGFFGFFGAYESAIRLIPGLPPIEIGNFYILLTVVKAWNIKEYRTAFYYKHLQILAVYIIFLYLQSYAIGVYGPLNVHFRIIKYIFPFIMFWSIPRLFTREEQYMECYKYIFPVVLIAFFAQLFTIMMQMSPLQYFGIEENRVKILVNLEVTEDRGYRGIYNESLLIIGSFGAFVYLAMRQRYFPNFYLYLVAISIFLSYFLSASRGYIIGFLMMVFLYVALAAKLTPKNTLSSIVAVILFGVSVFSIPVLKMQSDNAIKRMETMEALAEGDKTAGGTLARLTERAPRVMRVWEKSKLTGWGYSNVFFESNDMHVGNHSLLLNVGIIGVVLMGWFFISFNMRMVTSAFTLPSGHPYRRVFWVFPIIFMGWFLIHSTHQFYFSFWQVPRLFIIQVMFFDHGDLIHYRLFRAKRQQSENKETQSDAETPPPEDKWLIEDASY